MAKPRRALSSDEAVVTVAVRVRPGAGRTRVGGRYDGPRGPALIVAVGAPAVDGKATEAVRRALADALGVRPADVVLRIGATSRDKVFAVAGGGEVADRLRALRDGAARDGAARDGAARDGAARDGAARDGAARDGAARDGAARDGAARDGAAGDGGPRDGGPRGGGPRGGGPRGGGPRDGGPRDGGPRDGGPRDGT
jgi:uncharacterized protein